jgi:hypothetical protein
LQSKGGKARASSSSHQAHSPETLPRLKNGHTAACYIGESLPSFPISSSI